MSATWLEAFVVMPLAIDRVGVYSALPSVTVPPWRVRLFRPWSLWFRLNRPFE